MADTNAHHNPTHHHSLPPAHAVVPINAVTTATPSQPQAHVNLNRCRLSLVKGEHRWRFRWEPGCEAAVISAVADLARNPRMNFDWFDAAIVCRHIAQGLPARNGASHASPSSTDTHRNKWTSRSR